MSAPYHLPQRHLNLLTSAPRPKSQFWMRPSISDRLLQLLGEIEVFLLACTYEEMCNFWDAISNLRQHLQSQTRPAEMPQFLAGRRKQRDFCRILEVLADLPYPKLHLSHHLTARSGDQMRLQQSDFGYPHLAVQR